MLPNVLENVRIMFFNKANVTLLENLVLKANNPGFVDGLQWIWKGPRKAIELGFLCCWLSVEKVLIQYFLGDVFASRVVYTVF